MTTTTTERPDRTTTTHRATWALWGTAAGIGGVLTNLVFVPDVGDAMRKKGDASSVVGALDQGMYQLSAIAGFLTVACLLLFAAGLGRWAKAQSSDSLALRTAPTALVASAGALIAAYGVKGMLASYLPGGFNEDSYSDAGRYFYFLLDDLAGYYSWWGVAMAAACIAVLGLRERLVPRWVGALGALTALVPLVFLVTVGFTGFSGIIAPVFLVIAGVGLSRMRD